MAVKQNPPLSKQGWKKIAMKKKIAHRVQFKDTLFFKMQKD